MTHDTSHPPPLTTEQQAELAALEARPDDAIDTTEIPEWTDEQWSQSVRGNPFLRPIKAHTSLRLDADVLHWLKSKGRGYQTRVNAYLRRMMQEEVAGGS